MSHFSETTRIGYFARLKNAFKGIGLGVGFIGVAVYFLFWNEGNSVRTAQALAEGAGVVVSVDNRALDPAREGDLVHINGPLALPTLLSDPTLGVRSNPQTVRLERVVEQFAWLEQKRTSTSNKVGGSQEKTTDYSYRMDWTASPASGAEFRISEGHMNPPMLIKSQVIRQQKGAIGAFAVNDEISNLGGSVPLLLDADQMQAVTQALAVDGAANLVAGKVVIGDNVTVPQLGDMRISYLVSDIDTASVVGEQRGADLVPFSTQNGRQIYLVEKGLKTADEMFQTAVDTNKFKTWLLRIGLMVLLFLGFKAVFSLIDVLAGILPFLGGITSFVTTLISFALALVVGGGTIAIAWLYYRPILSLAIFGIALVGAVLGIHFARRSARAASADLQT